MLQVMWRVVAIKGPLYGNKLCMILPPTGP